MMRAVAIMKILRGKVSLSLLLVIALLLLLPLLAFLQYRWLGQVSQAERERMLANLQRAVKEFGQEFDRELARAFLHFQLHGKMEGKDAGAQIAKLWSEWKTQAPSPQIISQLYWVDSRAGNEQQIFGFDEAAGSLTRQDWPTELTPWRDRLNEGLPEIGPPLAWITEARVAKPAGVRPEGIIIHDERAQRDSPRRAIAVELGSERKPVPVLGQSRSILRSLSSRIIEEHPSLAIPVFDQFEGMPEGRGGASDRKPPQIAGYLLMRIDLDYLRRDYFPALANRYFSGGQGLDYQVLISTRRDPRRIIYQSDPAFGLAAADKGDASAGIFAVRLEDFGSILMAQMPEHLKGRIGVGSRTDRFTLKVYSRESAGDGNQILIPEVDGYWMLTLKHRAGSLEAAVASVRRRSLAISFGILLLLGASVFMLIIATRRAQRLAAQQMEFVAGVSHELRTPLAVIRSAAENLADGYIGEQEQVKRYGAVIRDEGRRLSEMVEQVLEVAGVQSGRRAYQLHPTEPQRIVEQALGASRMGLEEGDFTLEMEIDEELPLVNADAAALSRAIQNLISNAIKYSGESRWIGFRVKAARVDGGRVVRVTVADRGIGIDAEEVDRIFEPFYRGGEVVAAQIHGSGLGLSLVKQIVDAHGGKISVESEPGKGSSFTIQLPAVEKRELIEELAGGYEQTRTAH